MAILESLSPAVESPESQLVIVPAPVSAAAHISAVHNGRANDTALLLGLVPLQDHQQPAARRRNLLAPASRPW